MIIKILCLVAAFAAYEAATVRSAHVNKYILYTRANRREPFDLDSTNIATAPFVDGVPTVVLIHGQGVDSTNAFHTMVINAFLESENLNVIVVNWSTYANLAYATAVVAVPSVGINLAAMLILLEGAPNEKISFDELHIVGFGLGAHAAGFAGRQIRQASKRVARITGLDPSGSQWENNPQRLSATDAYYVEAIHTDGSGINSNGIGMQIADVDFFVNGGGNQPGCLNNACSHSRSYEVFSSSLTHGGLEGRQCLNNAQLALNMCRGYVLPLGRNTFDKFGDGIFRVNTGKSYPF